MTPRVSVILPVWNGAATIARAVASVRAQTWADWELLVVDDGSTDGTREVLRELAGVEKRMRVMEKEHAGVAAAANAGMAVARGEFIARMDADDECAPERLAEQVAWLAAAKEGKGKAGGGDRVDVVSGLVEFGGDRVVNAGYALHVDWVNALRTPEEIALNRFVEQPVVNPSVMFRRELVERLGGFRDGDFPEDYELWLRWLDAGVRVGKVPRVLLRWNDSARRATRVDARYAPEKFFRVKAEWIAREVKRVMAREGEAGKIEGERKIFVWGAGRHTRKRAAALEAFGVRIAGYVDVDAKKIGRGIGGTGLPVIGVEALPVVAQAREGADGASAERSGVFVLSYVSTRGAREYNRERLLARGYVEGRDFLMCA